MRQTRAAAFFAATAAEAPSDAMLCERWKKEISPSSKMFTGTGALPTGVEVGVGVTLGDSSARDDRAARAASMPLRGVVTREGLAGEKKLRRAFMEGKRDRGALCLSLFLGA